MACSKLFYIVPIFSYRRAYTAHKICGVVDKFKRIIKNKIDDKTTTTTTAIKWKSQEKGYLYLI